MRLRTWRVDAGLRLEDFCPRLGMTLNRLSNIERGIVWPTPVEIAMILEVTETAAREREPVSLNDLYQTWHSANPGAVNDFRGKLAMVG